MQYKATVLGVVGLLAGCCDIRQAELEPGEVFSGGATTVFESGRNAYSLPAANLDFSEQLTFKVGNSFFKNPWVSSPATTTARDGLGPFMNTNGCQNCHIKDGRGHAPTSSDAQVVSLLIRLSRPAKTEDEKELVRVEGGLADPVYGGQLQDFAIQGIAPEGQVRVEYSYETVSLKDGELVELRKPVFHLDNPGYGEFARDIETSARIAPPMIGLGLLESIPEAAILAQADENDRNKDGISGRPNWVKDYDANNQALGRFGWKAGQPTLRQQNAAAFVGDMGLTSNLFQGDDCTPAQTQCKKMPNGGEPEVPEKIMDSVTFYSQHLAVPARRKADDPQVLWGKRLFNENQCATCHTPSYITSENGKSRQLSRQTIWPYTDLLLHDMGAALSDNRPEFLAEGKEWRTPPLWGIGLAQVVSPEANFLHDGRARTILEAILWHGGEAQKSSDAVAEMEPEERKALLAFMNSL